MVATPQPKRKKLLKKLKSRFRLTVLNERTYEETFSYSLTPMNVINMFGGLLTVFGVLIYLLVAFTPLKNYIIPDYADAGMREEARLARVKADSLSEVVRRNEKYLADLRIVLSGGTLSNKADTSAHTQVQQADLNYQVSGVDNNLRQKISEQDRFYLAVEEDASSSKKGLLLFRPVNGTLSSSFNPKEGHYGIDLVAPKEDPVKAVLDGTVILASFTANDGNVIQIQHANNFISVYKHNSALLKKSGDYVKAGESIAFIGNSGDHSDGPHLHFELWEGGVPVNPLNYLSMGK